MTIFSALPLGMLPLLRSKTNHRYTGDISYQNHFKVHPLPLSIMLYALHFMDADHFYAYSGSATRLRTQASRT